MTRASSSRSAASLCNSARFTFVAQFGGTVRKNRRRKRILPQKAGAWLPQNAYPGTGGAGYTVGMKDNPPPAPQPSPFDAFTDLTRRVLAVPKAEVDKAET